MTAPSGHRSALSRVRHLGSAKDGVHHWWMQRLTSVALALLTLWFVPSVVALVGADRAAVLAWLGSPATVALMALTIVAVFHHAQLGMQVVIEDYVPDEGWRLLALMVVKLAAVLMAAVSLAALAFAAFKG